MILSSWSGILGQPYAFREEFPDLNSLLYDNSFQTENWGNILSYPYFNPISQWEMLLSRYFMNTPSQPDRRFVVPPTPIYNGNPAQERVKQIRRDEKWSDVLNTIKAI